MEQFVKYIENSSFVLLINKYHISENELYIIKNDIYISS